MRAARLGWHLGWHGVAGRRLHAGPSVACKVCVSLVACRVRLGLSLLLFSFSRPPYPNESHVTFVLFVSGPVRRWM